MLFRLAVSYIMLERRKIGVEAAAAYQVRLDEWLVRCGAGRRKIRLAFSKDITAPIAAGPYRPSILIPHRIFEALSEDELNHVGLHEAAHFSRRDDFALIFQRIIEAVFVFHPVVQWITRRIDFEREVACDDFVVQLTGSARGYAVCLTRVAELASGTCGVAPAASATEPRSHLETRVEMLLDSSRKTSTCLLKSRLIGAVCMLCLVLGMAAAMPSLLLFATPAAAGEGGAVRPAAAGFSEPIPPEPAESPRPSATPQAPHAGNPVPNTSAGSALVQIPVVVTDSRGRYVSGLAKENFKVFEDGAEQSIAAVSTNSPISVAFVYEIEDGETGADVLQQATNEFKTTAKPGDEFWILYGFNGQVEVSSGLQNSDEIAGRVKSTTAEPVPLADGLRQALSFLRASRNADKIIVILSDGNEHYTPVVPPVAISEYPEAYFAGARAGHSEATVKMASAGDARIYAISLKPLYPSPTSTLGAAAGPALLDEIAESTGGRHFAIANTLETQSTITRMDVEVRNLYSVEYRRENAPQSGKNIQTRVEIAPPNGIQGLYAHIRPGYSIPGLTGMFSTIDRAALSSSRSLSSNLSSSDPVIISDTEGLDFTGYLKGITDRVRSNWFSRIPDAAKQGQKGGVQLTFTILRDGAIQAARVSKGSGRVSFDQASLESVEASAPFTALPPRFKQDRIVVQLSFFYNLN
jgi:VWFA-related protein/TonB family protein